MTTWRLLTPCAGCDALTVRDQDTCMTNCPDARANSAVLAVGPPEGECPPRCGILGPHSHPTPSGRVSA